MPVNGACSELKAGRMKIENRKLPNAVDLGTKIWLTYTGTLSSASGGNWFYTPRHGFDEDDY